MIAGTAPCHPADGSGGLSVISFPWMAFLQSALYQDVGFCSLSRNNPGNVTQIYE
jgi:hypothetical protein